MYILRLIVKYRDILYSVTRVELAKKYAGSVFGMVWVILNPALLLSVYLFVYMVVFPMRFKDFSTFDYVLYVFCGLVPYIGFMEALTTGCHCIKQNIHLIKNVMMPIDLVPVRTVAVSIVSMLVSLGVVLILSLLNSSLSPHVVWLPAVVTLQVIFLIGLVFIFSSLAVALPDVVYFVNLAVLLLMFISPIGFKEEMLPSHFKFIVILNPIYYMTEVYRCSILYGKLPSLTVSVVYAILCLGTFILGCTFFRKFKGVLADYE